MNTATTMQQLDDVMPGWYNNDVWMANLSADGVLGLNYVKTYVEVLRHVYNHSHLVCLDTIGEHVILFKHLISTLHGFTEFLGNRILSDYCDDALQAIEHLDSVELVCALARIMGDCQHDIDVIEEGFGDC